MGRAVERLAEKVALAIQVKAYLKRSPSGHIESVVAHERTGAPAAPPGMDLQRQPVEETNAALRGAIKRTKAEAAKPKQLPTAPKKPAKKKGPEFDRTDGGAPPSEKKAFEEYLKANDYKMYHSGDIDSILKNGLLSDKDQGRKPLSDDELEDMDEPYLHDGVFVGSKERAGDFGPEDKMVEIDLKGLEGKLYEFVLGEDEYETQALLVGSIPPDRIKKVSGGEAKLARVEWDPYLRKTEHGIEQVAGHVRVLDLEEPPAPARRAPVPRTAPSERLTPAVGRTQAGSPGVFTKAGVRTRVQSVVDRMMKDLGGPKTKVTVVEDPDEWYQTWIDNRDPTVEHTAGAAPPDAFAVAGKAFVGPNAVRDLREVKGGLSGSHIVAHELAHTLSGIDTNIGLAAIVEEGAAETVAAAWLGQNLSEEFINAPYNERTLPNGDTAQGVDRITSDAPYQERVIETIMTAIRHKGFDREAVLADVRAALDGDRAFREKWFRDDNGKVVRYRADVRSADVYNEKTGSIDTTDEWAPDPAFQQMTERAREAGIDPTPYQRDMEQYTGFLGYAPGHEAEAARELEGWSRALLGWVAGSGSEVKLARTYVGPYLRVGEHGQIERVDPYWRTYEPGEVLPSQATREAPAPTEGLPVPRMDPLEGLPIRENPRLGNEATTRGEHIEVGPKFNELSPDQQRHALIHEAAHLHGLDDDFLESGADWDLKSKIDVGHLNGQTTPGEIIAEAYAVLWDEPGFLDEHAPELRDLVTDLARKKGLPIPGEVDETPHLLVAGSTKEDLAKKLDGYEIRYSNSGYSNYLIVEDPKEYGQEVAHLDYHVNDAGDISINGIYVDPKYRKKGIAVGMLAALHERFDRTLEHGSFASPEGAQLGFFMASHYPDWNRLWLGVDQRQGYDKATGKFPSVYWKPGDPITGDEATFAPMPYEVPKERVLRAVAKGLEGAPAPQPPEPEVRPASTYRRGDVFATVKDAEDYVRERYGYADFTGMTGDDLVDLSRVIDEVDRIAEEFPQVTNGTIPGHGNEPEPWRFQGIGTVDVAPPNVREGPYGMLDSEGNVRAWAATRNTRGGPRIWLSTGEAFRQGTGEMGRIGFTFERTPDEAIVHEMGHVMQSITRGAERQWQYTVDRIWPWTPKSKRGPKVSISKDIAVYADRSFEGFASLFSVMNIRGGLERLTPAARRRVIAAAAEMNEAARDRAGREVRVV